MTFCTMSDPGKKVCAYVCEYVCLRFTTKWFLLEGRQTAIETVVWHGQKRGRESETEREIAVDVGVVKLTVPPFTQVLSSLNPEKLAENRKDKRSSEATLSVGGLRQSPTAKHQDNTSLCSLANLLRNLKSALIDSCLESGQITAMLH